MAQWKKLLHINSHHSTNLNVTFHEQQECGYGFPSLPLATRASADVHEWRSHECLKNILTHPLRHTWPEVVMGNHTHTSAVHGKSFHNGLTKRSIIFIFVLIWGLSDHCALILKNSEAFINFRHACMGHCAKRLKEIEKNKKK